MLPLPLVRVMSVFVEIVSVVASYMKAFLAASSLEDFAEPAAHAHDVKANPSGPSNEPEASPDALPADAPTAAAVAPTIAPNVPAAPAAADSTAPGEWLWREDAAPADSTAPMEGEWHDAGWHDVWRLLEPMPAWEISGASAAVPASADSAPASSAEDAAPAEWQWHGGWEGWEAASLLEPRRWDDETNMAREFGIRWQDRGPPPEAVGPYGRWRGQRYREHSGRWGNRGGQWAQWFNVYYRHINSKGKREAQRLANEACGL